MKVTPEKELLLTEYFNFCHHFIAAIKKKKKSIKKVIAPTLWMVMTTLEVRSEQREEKEIFHN